MFQKSMMVGMSDKAVPGFHDAYVNLMQRSSIERSTAEMRPPVESISESTATRNSA